MTIRLHHGTSSEALDTAGDRLAKRMATLLADERRRTGVGVRALARASAGRYTGRDLRRIEAGRIPLTPDRASQLAELYGLDLATALPPRVPLEIRPFGVLSANGVARSFTPDDDTSLMTAYIELIRAVRNDDTTRLLDLRRADIELLAEQLSVPGDVVVERLAGLMGATLVQRRTMAHMFVAGALVISLGGAAPSGGATASTEPTPTGPHPTAPVRMRTTPRHSPWSSAAMIDRAGHRQLLNPVFSWSPPPRAMSASPTPLGQRAESAESAEDAEDQSIEPIWVPTS